MPQLAKIFSVARVGLSTQLVDIEADISFAFPGFTIVGLADKSIEESKERVRQAIINSGFEFPRGKVVINLAPATFLKKGTHYDFAIAVAILLAGGQITLGAPDQQALFCGELSLFGELRSFPGVLAFAMFAKKQGIKRIFLPVHSCAEASCIAGLEIIPVQDLVQFVRYCRKELEVPLYEKKAKVAQNFFAEAAVDMADIQGQDQAKRALEIAATGHHHVSLVGSPGVGKSMLAKALPGILSPLSFEESLETSSLYSISGLLDSQNPLINNRPFRHPHHSASQVSLLGGGHNLRPGEISLAHNGVLFLDEFAEFPARVIDALRQPLEDKKVVIARAQAVVEYPCDFILLVAYNPCPCGYFLTQKERCQCPYGQIMKYQKKMSGPILDRIDLHCILSMIPFEEMMKTKSQTKNETSQQIRTRVLKAKELQQDRYKSLGITSNAQLSHKYIEHYCAIDAQTKALLTKAKDHYQLSMRSYHKVLKVARSIADLAQSEAIKMEHVLEALQFRFQEILVR